MAPMMKAVLFPDRASWASDAGAFFRADGAVGVCGCKTSGFRGEDGESLGETTTGASFRIGAGAAGGSSSSAETEEGSTETSGTGWEEAERFPTRTRFRAFAVHPWLVSSEGFSGSDVDACWAGASGVSAGGTGEQSPDRDGGMPHGPRSDPDCSPPAVRRTGEKNAAGLS